MSKIAPAVAPYSKPSIANSIGQRPSPLERGLLGRLGGRQFVNQTVSEFYQAIGKYLAPEDSADHGKQVSRQSQFLIHALSSHPEPMHSARASFLAQGLNPALFEALLEYLEALLLQEGYPAKFSSKLVGAAGDLFQRCEEPQPIAC